ncbi:MAG: Type 1 glutamine amidotransferase-like domain-containing protein [Phocaeicola sp.]
MKKLFLSSSFSEVVGNLKAFANEDLKGKSVTFIPTASLPEIITFYVELGRETLENLGLRVDILELTQATEVEIASKLNNNDYIYISGGNTFFLLQELRRSGADKLVIEQINKGKLYIGESAGTMILAPNIAYVQLMDDVQKAPKLIDFAALNVIDFYPLPHYKSSPFEEITDTIIEKHKSELNLYPISNTQVILVENEVVNIVSN